MKFRTVTTAGVGLLASLLGVAPAHAGGCCGGGGGGGYRGGYGGGHTFNAGYYGGGMSCCSMGMEMGMSSMPGMNMAGMDMGGSGGSTAYAPPASYAPAAIPTDGGVRPPAATPPTAAAAARYYCPMHPSVLSSTPGTCPICHMALVQR